MSGFRNISSSSLIQWSKLVNYRKERILSRMVCNSTDIRIVLFSFDEAEEITEEQTPNTDYFLLLEGKMDIFIAGERRRLNAGEGIVVPAETPHALHAVSACKMLQMSLKEENEMKTIIQHIPMGRVFEMAEQIQYEKHQVSSVTLVKKPTLIITLFALDAGEEIGGHASTGDAMVELLDGEAEITIGETVHRVKKGEVLIMPANIRHALKAVKPFKMLLTVVKE